MRVRRSSAERSSTCYTPATKGRRPVNSDLSKAGYLDFSSTSSECGSREWVTRQVTVERVATRGGGESSSSGVVLCRAYSPPSPTRPLLAAAPSRGLLSSRLLVGRWQLFFILKHFHCTEVCSNSTGIVTLRPSAPSSVLQCVSDPPCFSNSTGHSLCTDGQIEKMYNVSSHGFWHS